MSRVLQADREEASLAPTPGDVLGEAVQGELPGARGGPRRTDFARAGSRLSLPLVPQTLAQRPGYRDKPPRRFGLPRLLIAGKQYDATLQIDLRPLERLDLLQPGSGVSGERPRQGVLRPLL